MSAARLSLPMHSQMLTKCQPSHVYYSILAALRARSVLFGTSGRKLRHVHSSPQLKRVRIVLLGLAKDRC